MRLLFFPIITSLLILSDFVGAKRVFKLPTIDIDSDLEKRDQRFDMPERLSDQEAIRPNEGLYADVTPGGEDPRTGTTLLQTSLVLERGISVFSSYLRNNVQLSARCNDDSFMTTIFAPSNKALSTLSSKPWEFPQEIDTSYPENADKIAQANIEDFIQNHIAFSGLDLLPLKNNEVKSITIRTEDNHQIEVCLIDGQLFITPTGLKKPAKPITVSNIREAGNGIILVIDGTLSWPGKH